MMDAEFSNPLGADLAKIGDRLHKLREECGWGLKDLGQRTNLSKAHLSRLESGERQPSLRALIDMARAYGLSISSLLEPEPEAENLVVVRASEGKTQHGNGLSYTRLSVSEWAFDLQPLRVVIPADREGDAIYQHEGEQWLYVLSGRLRFFEVEGKEILLEEGDAAHFDANHPHRVEAVDGCDVQVIVVACALPYTLLKSYL
jgi:transcriptional regulator with XRE-family HTH domain